MKFAKLLNFHRVLGVSSCLFIFILSITGLLINHSETLGLENKKISWSWLMHWYGLKAPNKVISFNSGTQHVTQIEQGLYLDELEIGNVDETLIGVLKKGQLFILAFANKLILFSEGGEKIESIEAHHDLPVPILKVGYDQNKICLRSEKDYYFDLDALSFQAIENPIAPKWSDSAVMPKHLKDKLFENFQGHISLQKLILDLHSGKVLGALSVYFLDLVGIACLILTTSGLWLYFKRNG